MFDVYICCPFERVSTCLFTKLVALLSLSVRVMHPGATLATNSSFHLTGERREDMILNQNISTIHVLCVGCTVQPARPFFSARRSQLQLLARSSHGGETGERGLAAGWAAAAARVAKFRFSTLARDGRTPLLVSTWTKQSDWMRVPGGKLVLRTSVTGVLVRTGLIGPQSLWVLILSFPTGGMTLVVRRAGLPASPGSRLFGHVTKILVTWPPTGRPDHIKQLHKVPYHISTAVDWQLKNARQKHLLWKNRQGAAASTSNCNLVQKLPLIPCWARCRPAAGGGGPCGACARQVFSSDTQYRHCFPDICHLATEQTRSSQSVIEGLKAWSLSEAGSPPTNSDSCHKLSLPKLGKSLPLKWPNSKGAGIRDWTSWDAGCSDQQQEEDREQWGCLLVARLSHLKVEQTKVSPLSDVYGVHRAALSWASRHRLPGKHQCQPHHFRCQPWSYDSPMNIS